MLELKNICFERDNKKILDNVNLKLEDNKHYVITGPNGSGKSTLAKIIMGISKQDSGQVLFNDKDISDLSVFRDTFQKQVVPIGEIFGKISK